MESFKFSILMLNVWLMLPQLNFREHLVQSQSVLKYLDQNSCKIATTQITHFPQFTTNDNLLEYAIST